MILVYAGEVRAERLLSVLMLLRSRGQMTAAALAVELEVSERTVLRDIDALSVSGVPVYAERGRNGGFALVEGYRTDLTGLTLDEAIALLSGNGRIDSPASASALRKLEAALPEMHRGRVAEASQRILVRPEGFVAAPQNTDWLAVVQRAVFDGWRIRLRYKRPGAEAVERKLDPIGLIVAGDTWYLVANSYGKERMYRMSDVGCGDSRRACRPAKARRPRGSMGTAPELVPISVRAAGCGDRVCGVGSQ